MIPPKKNVLFYSILQYILKGGSQSDLTNLEFINFWIASIIAHATPPAPIDGQISPRIFIVGTHRDSIPGSEEEKQEYVSF